MIMGHECKRWMVWEAYGSRRGKETILRGEEDQICYICIYEDSIMKSTTHFEKGRK
jgi:hypothetical protein